MPLYEFTCGKCHAGFELLLPRRSAIESAACTACGSRQVRRRMSACAARSASAAGGSSLGGADACSGCRRSSCAGCHSA